MRRKELTTAQVTEMREGILMARRNHENNCDAPFDCQVPRGRVRSKAYFRTWVRCVYGRVYFPPKASYTKKHPATHGPTPQQRIEQLWSGESIDVWYHKTPAVKQ